MARQGATRKATREKGVYELVSETRTYNRKPDVCYYIAFKIEGKLTWEKIGWISEGYSIKLAANIRAERMRSLRHGDDLPKQKKKVPTFKEVMEKYLAWADTSKTNGRTTDSYLYKHLTRFDEKRLDEIHPFALEGLKQDILNKGLSPATAKHILVLVGEVFNKAIIWGLYQGDNPIKKVKMPILQNKRERFLSHDEANALLSTLKERSQQLHGICVLSLYCGLRMGEIFNLRGQDLDFINDLIHVSDPKNKHPRKAYMTETVKEMLFTRKPDSPGDFLFKNRKGDKIASISRSFERVVDELGFNRGIADPRQKVVAHSLRHTFASWLAIQGTPIYTIASLMGHKSIAMSERYSHLSPDHKKEAVLNLEKGINQAKGVHARIKRGDNE